MNLFHVTSFCFKKRTILTLTVFFDKCCARFMEILCVIDILPDARAVGGTVRPIDMDWLRYT